MKESYEMENKNMCLEKRDYRFFKFNLVYFLWVIFSAFNIFFKLKILYGKKV